MALNNNIFCVTNPACMVDALIDMMDTSGVNVQDMLIFVPSRRAVRTVEQALVKRAGHAVILPHLVALGEGVDGQDDEIDNLPDVISNLERVVVVAKMLTADTDIKTMSVAIPVARDLVRMQDYMENEGVDATAIKWGELVDKESADHFKKKKIMLEIISKYMEQSANGRITQVQFRNKAMTAWKKRLADYKLVVVCGSTASVPVTADLMAEIAKLPHGRIILSGKIDGRIQDFGLNTNPYKAEYEFLKKIGVEPEHVVQIDMGKSAIDFLNYCMGNNIEPYQGDRDLSHCHLIEANHESQEAYAVAEIACREIKQKKSVLIITPDSAGNQRIETALNARGIRVDSSAGLSGSKVPAGRAILNLLDKWNEENPEKFNEVYTENNSDLFNTIAHIVAQYKSELMPRFVVDDDASVAVWGAIRELSRVLENSGIVVSGPDAYALIADVLSGVSVRRTPTDEPQVIILGTIESRMQTADVVILTGLNDGMFPARGYENSWLSRALSTTIGLPSPDKKVSLQALDFMNLSCGNKVYWVRSKMSGGAPTMKSRFLSRVDARNGVYNRQLAQDIIKAVEEYDNVPENPLDSGAPMPPADWSDVPVTSLKYLIHNPYVFYVHHILQLRPKNDWWEKKGAADFGDLVHQVIEETGGTDTDVMIAEMDARATQMLGEKSVVLHFWKKRFREIAPVVADELSKFKHKFFEQEARYQFPVGQNGATRTITARADLIWEGGVVDFKTGADIPNPTQLKGGMVPQLPIEALMFQKHLFDKQKQMPCVSLPTILFVQMKNKDVKPVWYDADKTEVMIDGAVKKITEVFNQFTAGMAPYEYRPGGGYKKYDDFIRPEE